MNESNPTVKVTGGGMGSTAPANYAGQGGSGNAPGGWEETQYMADQPTPRPGEVAPPWQQPARGPSAWEAQPPGTSGAPTMLIPTGPKSEPSFAWLVMVSGVGNNPAIGQPLPIKSVGTTTLGRVPGNDIVVPDAACSSQHAKLRSEPGEDGKPTFVIYDLASTNGLYAGTKENYKDEANRKYRHVLHDGDYILMGETTLVFKQV